MFERFTPNARQTLMYAQEAAEDEIGRRGAQRAPEDADALGHSLVGTEHVLIALRPDLRERVLRALEGEELP